MVVEPVRQCGICGGQMFKEYNTRPHAQCAACRSLERTRLLWAVLDLEIELTAESRVLHFAPELALATRFQNLSGRLYKPCDVDPAKYRSFPMKVHHIDLCNLSKEISGSYDLIVHNHVLEHIRCDVESALRELSRLLRPGGSMLFSVPFRGQVTREYLGDDMTNEERTREFGQPDHLRLFGRSDFVELLDRIYEPGSISYDMREKFTEEDLLKIAVPKKVLLDLSGETIFHYRKPA